MRGAIHPLLNTPSWRGAQLKHSDDYTYTLIYTLGLETSVFLQSVIQYPG